MFLNNANFTRNVVGWEFYCGNLNDLIEKLLKCGICFSDKLKFN